MKALFLFKFTKNFKYELILIGGVLILLILLPVAAVIALIDGALVSNTSGIYQGPPDPKTPMHMGIVPIGYTFSANKLEK